MTSVSVIMAVYNEPLDWLTKSIDSVLGQTLRDIELIVINDNPGRVELEPFLERYAERDKRIRILTNPENIGLTKSLNKAIECARGELLARMDGDDISLPNRLNLQYRFLESHPDIFLVGCSVRIIDRNGRARERAIKHADHERIVKDILSGRLGFYHPTIMFRNEGVLYRERFETTQDLDLYLNLLSEGRRFANLRQVLMHYRISDQNISVTMRKKQIVMKKLALKFYEERAQGGRDSYDNVAFDTCDATLDFLGVSRRQVEALVLKQEMVFALGGGNYEAARRAFALYAKSASMSIERALLWVFVHFPTTYRAYRKLRYEILAG